MNKSLLKSSIGRILMLSLPLVILILAIILLAKVQQKLPEMITGGTPSPTPTPEFYIPSRWATDSGVLEIEVTLKTISHDLGTVDLKETGLIPPVLDMEVKF